MSHTVTAELQHSRMPCCLFILSIDKDVAGSVHAIGAADKMIRSILCPFSKTAVGKQLIFREKS